MMTSRTVSRVLMLIMKTGIKVTTKGSVMKVIIKILSFMVCELISSYYPELIQFRSNFLKDSLDLIVTIHLR